MSRTPRPPKTVDTQPADSHLEVAEALAKVPHTSEASDVSIAKASSKKETVEGALSKGLHGHVSPTRENYLKFILLEERENGTARACNLANVLGVTRSTVATTFRELKADGLIDYVPYGPIHLTDKGLALAEQIVDRYEAVQSFFSSVLDLDSQTSSKIACELEHVLSDAVVERLRHFATHIDLHRAAWERHEGHEDVSTAESAKAQ